MSSLLGILEGLGNLLSTIFSGLFKFLINYLVIPVVKCAIRVLITVIQYFTSTIFYEISKFLLGLIDFVEVLFRALAGLPANTAGDITISMTLDGKDGDLLISMLTSHEVIQAFYATAIVGMFLLIITTIFQMIKVEYTTEGAQNSKTTILGKSLKSLCNMLIVPLLCILGVFIGNQVLDLIDTATGGGKGTKISSQLWVTAASEALVNEGDMYTSLKNVGVDCSFATINNSGGLLSCGITLALTKGFQSILEPEKAETPVATPFSGDDTARAVIEQKYLSGDKSFYDTYQMLENYNPFEVNYLVLIFGACIIIKCLFYTCFGLIDRLYQCVALFIVMPMVIGMSPVKDSLGSWRSKFMSKALSAYGTVISLNLFFIIVKVMLNIKIDFKSTGSGATTAGLLSVFSTSFMAGLIKSIMVIVGCLMIEKLAGDLGGYFGGGNAMAEGKGLAKDATAGITKAATLAAGVATGGASLAMKAGKAGMGLADKLTGGGVTRTGNKIKGGISAGVDKFKGTKFGKIANKVVHPGETAREGVNAIGKGFGKSGKYVRAQQAANEADANYDIQKHELESIKKDYGEDSKEYKEQAKITKDADKARSEARKKAHDAEWDLRRSFKGKNNVEDADNAVNKAKAKAEFFAKEEEEHQKATVLKNDKRVRNREGARQLWQDKFGANAMFSTFAPKSLQNLKKEYETAQKTAMDSSPEGQAMMARIDKAGKDEREQAFDKRNAKVIEQTNLIQTQLTLKAINEKLAVTNAETNKELQKMNKRLDELIAKRDEKGTSQEMKSAYANAIVALQQSMAEKVGRKLNFTGVGGRLDVNEKLEVDFRMDPGFMKKIEAEIKKGMKMDGVMEQINEEFKKIGLTDKDTLAKIYKALEELKSNFGGK